MSLFSFSMERLENRGPKNASVPAKNQLIIFTSNIFNSVFCCWGSFKVAVVFLWRVFVRGTM